MIHVKQLFVKRIFSMKISISAALSAVSTSGTKVRAERATLNGRNDYYQERRDGAIKFCQVGEISGVTSSETGEIISARGLLRSARVI